MAIGDNNTHFISFLFVVFSRVSYVIVFFAYSVFIATLHEIKTAHRVNSYLERELL